jgi:hypothetical protein
MKFWIWSNSVRTMPQQIVNAERSTANVEHAIGSAASGRNLAPPNNPVAMACPFIDYRQVENRKSQIGNAMVVREGFEPSLFWGMVL